MAAAANGPAKTVPADTPVAVAVAVAAPGVDAGTVGAEGGAVSTLKDEYNP